MKKYYHYTDKKNLQEIAKTNKLKGPVFVCPTKEDIYKFLGIRFEIEHVIENIVVLEFLTDAELKISHDHNSERMEGASAFYSEEDIKINNIEFSTFDS